MTTRKIQLNLPLEVHKLIRLKAAELDCSLADACLALITAGAVTREPTPKKRKG